MHVLNPITGPLGDELLPFGSYQMLISIMLKRRCAVGKAYTRTVIITRCYFTVKQKASQSVYCCIKSSD